MLLGLLFVTLKEPEKASEELCVKSTFHSRKQFCYLYLHLLPGVQMVWEKRENSVLELWGEGYNGRRLI